VPGTAAATTAAAEACAALDLAYRGITAVVEPLDEAGFFRPTRCAGWAICDLLVHVRMDAERALIAFATPSPSPADLDAVTYWGTWADDFKSDLAAAHARHIRVVASAYARPAGLVMHWRDIAEAAVRAAAAAPADGYVATQGHVLAVPDFVRTLVVEAAIHHLDLTAELPDAPRPAAACLRVVRETLTTLAGESAAKALGGTGWDDATLALKTTGRLELTEPERAQLGSLAERLPLFR